MCKWGLFVWRSLGVVMGVLRWGGCVFGGVGGLVLGKWHSLPANTHYKHEYSVLTSIWSKSGLSEFWKTHVFSFSCRSQNFSFFAQSGGSKELNHAATGDLGSYDPRNQADCLNSLNSLEKCIKDIQNWMTLNKLS